LATLHQWPLDTFDELVILRKRRTLCLVVICTNVDSLSRCNAELVPSDDEEDEVGEDESKILTMLWQLISLLLFIFTTDVLHSASS
jgi:hypothetical protein